MTRIVAALLAAALLAPFTARAEVDEIKIPRGAIRASLPDWLSISPHADRIVALRPAHISHGGGGAVYVILRREREE